MKRRILLMLAALLGAAGLAVGTSHAAFASTGDGNQWRAINYYNAPYANAWGGTGGFIKSYGDQTLNNDFTRYYSGSNNYMAFTPGNCDVHSCTTISDANNDPNDARAQLYTWANGDPWGSIFYATSCSVGGAAGQYLYNRHWGGYLAPSGNGGNGTQWYLNSATPYCLISYVPW